MKIARFALDTVFYKKPDSVFAMIRDFLNPTIFWEYEVGKLDADEWCPFIIKQVFNRNVVSEVLAIPSLMAYYGQEQVQ